ncbi:hypothetical protein [Staphylococcus phage S6]|nr:hypothetical protein [Staphylococcus phage S6]
MLNNNEKIILEIIMENFKNNFNLNTIKIISNKLSEKNKKEMTDILVNQRYTELIEKDFYLRIFYIMKKEGMMNDNDILDFVFNVLNDKTVSPKEINNLSKSLLSTKGLGKTFINKNRKSLLYSINNVMEKRKYHFNITDISSNYHVYTDIAKNGRYSDLIDEISFIEENKLTHIIPLYYKVNKRLMKEKDRNILINDIFINNDNINMNDLICLLLVLSESEVKIEINEKTKEFIRKELKGNFDEFKKEIYLYSERNKKNHNKMIMICNFMKGIFNDNIIIDKKFDNFIKKELVENTFK